MSPSNYMSNVRKQRALSQNITLIDIIYNVEENERAYLVVGTTGNLYKVIIKDIPECSCLDFKQHNTRCKHIYYVLMKIINTKYIDNPIYTTQQLHEMFGVLNKSYNTSDSSNDPMEIDDVIFTDTNINNANPNIKNDEEIEQDKVIDDICHKLVSDLNNIQTSVQNEITQPIEVDVEPKINIINNWMDDPIQVISNHKIVFENSVSNKFKFINEIGDIATTIGKYIEENYGIASKTTALKLYNENVKVDDLLKDNSFAGVYINKLNDSQYELYMKIIKKTNNGWIFNNYTETVENTKLGRFIIIDC